MHSQPYVGWRTPHDELGTVGYERTLPTLLYRPLISSKNESLKALGTLSLCRELVGVTVDLVTERMWSSGWTLRRKAASSRVSS